MRHLGDQLVHLRWLLLGAVSAGACGGNATTTRDAGGSSGSGGDAVAGAENPPSGTAGTANHPTSGGSASLAGAGGTGVAGSAGQRNGECVDPQPGESGFVTCGDGLVHRAAKAECKNTLPEAPVTCGFEPDTYVCDGKKREHCGNSGGGSLPDTSCTVGCVTDADCATDELCFCGAMIGSCVAAFCTVDADCEDGNFCRLVSAERGFGCGASLSFQCQRPADTCSVASDCKADSPYGQPCQPAMPGGPLRCEPVEGIACGRPYLVNGTPRLACLASDTDWAAALDLDPAALSADTRSALAEGWNRLGAMEHASVAAFARFTLQLLGLGAPHALVVESNRAIGDETRHAELCFGLAAAFGSTTAGPGKLESQGALDRSSLRDVVLDTFVEGCIGETVAALEATEALAHATIPAVRQVLEQIAEDEARHAALAWRFVAWGVAQMPECATGLRQRLDQACAGAERSRDVVAPRTAVIVDLAAGGLLGDRARAEVRLRALREIVVPCLASLPSAVPLATKHAIAAPAAG